MRKITGEGLNAGGIRRLWIVPAQSIRYLTRVFTTNEWILFAKNQDLIIEIELTPDSGYCNEKQPKSRQGIEYNLEIGCTVAHIDVINHVILSEITSGTHSIVWEDQNLQLRMAENVTITIDDGTGKNLTDGNGAEILITRSAPEPAKFLGTKTLESLQ